MSVRNVIAYTFILRASREQVRKIEETIRRFDMPIMAIVPSKEHGQFMAMVLNRYYDQNYALKDMEVSSDENFHYITVSPFQMREFKDNVTRLLRYHFNTTDVDPQPIIDAYLNTLYDAAGIKKRVTQGEEEVGQDVNEFLTNNTPESIAQKLDEYVLGQKELTKKVGDFLYYHMLRQRFRDLPMRSMMISGQSGCGKTEVWRAAQRIFGSTFDIEVIDGTQLTCEGYKGSYKIGELCSDMKKGTIVVIDEFDKLCRPNYGSYGDNYALRAQSEFLKLIEGEQGGKLNNTYGFVFVGAFEELLKKRNKTEKHIGFGEGGTKKEIPHHITDEEFIEYGILSEIVGRVAVKCTCNSLDTEDYMNIIENTHSRVSNIAKVLRFTGVDVTQIVSKEELKEIIDKSVENRTGVRGVSSVIENMLIDRMHNTGCPKNIEMPDLIRDNLPRSDWEKEYLI